MNRTIKFRAKRKGAPHEWLIGDLANIEDKVYIFDRGNNAPLNSPDWYEVIPETVGQFTGRKDENGIDIFEGDICRFDMMGRSGFVGQVKYSDNGMGYWFDLTKGAATLNAISNIEVIGNIHDNPELLKYPITHQ